MPPRESEQMRQMHENVNDKTAAELNKYKIDNVNCNLLINARYYLTYVRVLNQLDRFTEKPYVSKIHIHLIYTACYFS